jgi:multiple sugar transport system substrate-binding protein
VVFGGSSVHLFNPDVVDTELDVDAVRAFIAFSTGPEWSTRLNWSTSNPAICAAFGPSG